MKCSDRLSVALHVLLHMAEQPDHSLTSEQMAVCAQTHPVVIRRTFAGLRKAGIVSSGKGHGGGWRLGRTPAAITLADIQAALRESTVAPGKRDPASSCLVERAVNEALEGAVQEAERVLNAHLARITLADLSAKVGPQMAAYLASLPGSSASSLAIPLRRGQVSADSPQR